MTVTTVGNEYKSSTGPYHCSNASSYAPVEYSDIPVEGSDPQSDALKQYHLHQPSYPSLAQYL